MNKIKKYLESVALLNEIKGEIIKFLRSEGYTERTVHNFILNKYKKRKMIPPKEKPSAVVAFEKNTTDIHHIPRKNKIKTGPILIDVFAKLKNGCFADFTWMAYKGKPDKEFLKYFKIFVDGRNKGIKFIKRCLKKKYLPTLFEIDASVRSYFSKKYVGYAFKHRVGHALGKKVHDGGKMEYYEKLRINKPYAFEPGLYFKGKFGIRLENDFYIDKKFELHATKPQNKIIIT